jgi:glycine betaine/proline transport system ATP-binding protein
MIELRHVYKVFGPRPEPVLSMLRDGKSKQAVLRETGRTVGLVDVSLSVDAGETFVVMGLSGSGKSTLIRHLNRLVEPTAGEILVGGVDLMALSASELLNFRRHRSAMVFQHFGLLPHRSVLYNVGYGLILRGAGKAEWAGVARELIETVGLGGYEDKFPDQLSGGMAQRVGLARALATDPDILLLDEPFGSLDPLIRRELQERLLALQRELGKTIVFITHDLDEALRIGDRIAILRDGEVVQVGTAGEIVKQPADDYVRAFVRDIA